MADAAEIKEVTIDVANTEGLQAGGGTRRRRRARRSTRGQEGGDAQPTTSVAVEKAGAPAPAPAPVPVVLPTQAGGAPPPKVVIAPAKKKLAKVMLIPKGAVAAAPGSKPVRPVVAKTFKAKRMHLTIDNTARTVKRRRMELGRIDAMTDEQVRDAAVMARLAKRETVAKAPPALLRQMLKDYRMMRGQLL